MSPLQILLVENDDRELLLLQKELRASGLASASRVVGDQAAFGQALEERVPDLIIAGFESRNFDALLALEGVRDRLPGTPFVVVADSPDGSTAARCITSGAWGVVPRRQLVQLQPWLRAAHELGLLRESRDEAIREAETRFQQLADLVAAPVFCCDGSGRLRFGNRAWIAIVGSPEAEARDWLEAVHPDDREPCRQLLDGDPTPARPLEFECRLQSADGRPHRFAFACEPLRNGLDGFSGYLGCGRAVAAEKPVAPVPAGLPSSVRHELNNHLAVVRMYADFLAESRAMPANHAAKAREIVLAADHVTQMVRNLSQPPPLKS